MESVYAFTNNYMHLLLLSFMFFFTVPPTLRAVPQNGQVAARKGSTVTLECKASGNPVPSIYWFKRVSLRRFFSVFPSVFLAIFWALFATTINIYPTRL